MISNIIQWVRSNVLVVISVVAAAVAVGSLYWPIGAMNQDFQVTLNKQPGQLGSVQSFIDRTVTIPSDDPNKPLKEIKITVNQAAVNQLKQIYSRMNTSYDALFEQVVNINEFGSPDGKPVNAHKPMLDGLFPKAASEAVQYQSRQAYRNKFNDLYRQLGAGTPPGVDEIQQHQAEVTQEYMALHPGATAQDADLAKRIIDAQMSLLYQRALQIKVYADPPTTQPANQRTTSAAGVFDVGQWSEQTTKPMMGQLWEAQMQLWIQQDLVRAINVANPGDSVLNNPVKRVLSISVDPGYLGLNVQPAEDPKNPPQPASLDERLPEDFAISQTGRQCNPLYDVRLARMSVIVDARRIPKLLEALSTANFMTPVINGIYTVDQRNELASGYVYGDNVDVVRVDLTIETLWMRRWTAGSWDQQTAEQQQPKQAFDPGLMPDVVRYALALPVRDPNFKVDDAAGDVLPSSSGSTSYAPQRGGAPGAGGRMFGAPPQSFGQPPPNFRPPTGRR
jgi:hypothetical protein